MQLDGNLDFAILAGSWWSPDSGDSLLTDRAADSSRGEVGYEYRVERNRASSTSALEARERSASCDGRIRPALVAGFFIFSSLYRRFGSKPILRSAGSGDVPIGS
jgi:hypothetical protein